MSSNRASACPLSFFIGSFESICVDEILMILVWLSSDPPSVKMSSTVTLSTSLDQNLPSSNEPSVFSSPTSSYVRPVMSVMHNPSLQRGNQDAVLRSRV